MVTQLVERYQFTLCGEKDCKDVEADEECYNKTIVVVNDVPEESCDLVPNKSCKGVYHLVPYLKPKQVCKEVPKEVCTFGFQPRVHGEVPLLTKWCYHPSEEDSVSDSLENRVRQPHSFANLGKSTAEEAKEAKEDKNNKPMKTNPDIDRKDEIIFGGKSNFIFDESNEASSEINFPPKKTTYIDFDNNKKSNDQMQKSGPYL